MILVLVVLLLGAGASADLQCSVIPGRLKQVDAGAGQVYGVNDNDDIYQWVDNDWRQIPGKLIHVTVGPAGVWGVNRANQIYKLQDNAWMLVTGALKQIDAGGEKFLSGANGYDWIYCLNQDQTLSRSASLSYTQLDGSLKYYSCGRYGCWGVNMHNNIYYRHNVKPNACRGSHWQQIDGSLVMVEVGTDGSVYGVNANGDVYTRERISASNPMGSSWTKLDFCGSFRHVSCDQEHIWLLTKDGDIYKCKVSGAAVPTL
ncbi:fish-egg lectin-like [Engystomops pustulosus]|uniref:fish-egg lectin-like n=1 Tax=Engystomops pustulosus TaxID=76066 RepID=UPI003AFB6161